MSYQSQHAVLLPNMETFLKLDIILLLTVYCVFMLVKIRSLQNRLCITLFAAGLNIKLCIAHY